MDPQAAADVAADPTQPWAERGEAAHALNEWIARGGWLPAWPGRPSFGPSSDARRWVRERCLEVAAAAAAHADGAE